MKPSTKLSGNLEEIMSAFFRLSISYAIEIVELWKINKEMKSAKIVIFSYYFYFFNILDVWPMLKM